MAEESRGIPVDERTRYPAFRVCGKLRGPLSTLAGEAGHRALLLRALTLAKVDIPWLATVEVKADGAIDYLVKSENRLTRADALKGEHTLVVQLLSLLVQFIGESLTLRLLRATWPDAIGSEKKRTPQRSISS